MTEPTVPKVPMYYVVWDDGREGRIRTEFPRRDEVAVKCSIGLEEYGAEDVKIVPCREDGCTIPVWTLGDPGAYYFMSMQKKGWLG